ncbi:hypothetical protein ACFY20_33230, partial [Streptomyces sp. NPDC001312]|uniref:hypothetical protein n=1 Tax=Streptomyces sp. NPDC001312 TaxID=3364561 RepID=UPI00369658FF
LHQLRHPPRLRRRFIAMAQPECTFPFKGSAPIVEEGLSSVSALDADPAAQLLLSHGAIGVRAVVEVVVRRRAQPDRR